MLFSGWSWHTGTDQSTVCENISMKLQPSHPFCQCQCHILRWLADRSGGTMGSNDPPARWWLNHMLLKLDHFPRWRWNYKKYLKPPPSQCHRTCFLFAICFGSLILYNIQDWMDKVFFLAVCFFSKDRLQVSMFCMFCLGILKFQPWVIVKFVASWDFFMRWVYTRSPEV